MADDDRNRDELVEEIEALRRRVAELERAQTGAASEDAERWHFAVEGGGHGVWDWHAETNEMFYSDRLKRMLGFEPRDDLGGLEGWKQRIHPGDRDRVLDIIGRHLNGEAPAYVAEYRLKCKGGGYKWVLAKGKVVGRRADGSPLRAIGTCTDVTARRQAENALQESEQLVRGLLDASTDTVALIDVNGTIIDANGAVARRFNMSTDEFIGANVWDLHPRDLAESRRARFIEAIEKRQPVRFEDTRAGAWFDNIIYPIPDAEGELTRIAVFARDITERKQAEDELKRHRDHLDELVNSRTAQLAAANEKLREEIAARKRAQDRQTAMADGLRAVVAAADELIACADMDTLYRRAVELAKEKLGLERCSIYLQDGDWLCGTYGTNCRGQTTDERDYRYSTMPPGVQKRLASLGPRGRPWTTKEVPYSEWDGKEFRHVGQGWTAVTPIQSRRGSDRVGVFFNDTAITGASLDETKQYVLAVYCSLLANIVERKRAEEALRRSEKRFRDVFEKCPDAVFIEDLEGNVLDVNPAACRLHSMERQSLIGKNVLDLVPPEEREHVAREFPKLASGEWHHTEGYSLAEDGRSIAVELKSEHVDYFGKPALLLQVRDITERKQSEAEREALVQELREALARTKALSGLLPICASCKKIRDAENQWIQLELYMQDEHGIEFSHGICPDCAKRLYGHVGEEE